VKERPVLFSAPMVRAILEGRKTQTRRIAKWKPREPGYNLGFSGVQVGFYCSDLLSSGYVLRSRGAGGCWNDRTHPLHCPYGKPGDRLWVRETHARFSVGEGMDTPVPECVAYRATCGKNSAFDYANSRGEVTRLKVTKWTPAIHMPRWAARIELEVSGVRVERLHDITEEDAKAEGLRFDGNHWIGAGPHKWPTARAAFESLWCDINGLDSWRSNPWVWVVEIKRVEVARGGK
jgi:hypothetical protein